MIRTDREAGSLGGEPLAVSLAIPDDGRQTGGPHLDRFRLVHAQPTQGPLPLRRERVRKLEERTMHTLAADLDRPCAFGAHRPRTAHQDISLARAHTEPPRLVGEPVRGDPEEPLRTRAEEALRTQKVLELRI